MAVERTTTTDGACPSGVARLLGMAVGEAADATATLDDRKAALLELWLASGPGAGVSGPPAPPGGPRESLLPEGASLADVLLDGAAPLADLEALKEHHKKLWYAADDEPTRCAATAICFAAIASALLQHGTKISRYSHQELADAFARLAAEPWMAPELAGHFAKARSAAAENAPTRDA